MGEAVMSQMSDDSTPLREQHQHKKKKTKPNQPTGLCFILHCVSSHCSSCHLGLVWDGFPTAGRCEHTDRPAQTSRVASQAQLIAPEVSPLLLLLSNVTPPVWHAKDWQPPVSAGARLADGRCGWRSRFPIAEMTGRHKWAGMCEWQEAWHLRPWGGRPLRQWARHLRAGVQSGFSLFFFILRQKLKTSTD